MHVEQHGWHSPRVGRHDGHPRLRALRPSPPGLPHERGGRAGVRGPGDDGRPRPPHRRGQGEARLRRLRQQRGLVQQAGPSAAPELDAGRCTTPTSRTRWCPSSTTTAGRRASPSPPPGASFGAYHAANSLFKHPNVFRRCLALSGVYDIRKFMDGDYDDNTYFNNPVDYVASLTDPWYLHHLAQDDIRLVTGNGPYEDSGADLPLLGGPEVARHQPLAWTTGGRTGATTGRTGSAR